MAYDVVHIIVKDADVLGHHRWVTLRAFFGSFAFLS